VNQSIVVGIDISKSSFDAEWCDTQVRAQCFKNDESGFDGLVRWIPSNAHIVMEATGTYFLKLATFLYHAGWDVSVVNPAAPSYFARMKLMRTKTDSVDAGILRQYGEREDLTLWRPADDIFIELNQLDTHLVGLIRDLNRVSNRIEALGQCVTINEFTMRDLVSQESDLKTRIKQCEKELDHRVREQFSDLFDLLTSIRGIGKKSAVMFIVLTEAFTLFPDAKKFASYLGLSSFIKSSGTSVRGSGSISKMGSSRMRQLLYMAALAAKRKNKACMAFADRLKANGKPPKVVRIAVANKLVRQAFAIVKNQEIYSEAYA
jgi:transposase